MDEDDIARVMGRLQHAQSFGSNPLLLPTVLLSMSVHDFRSMQTEVFMECLELEETMGFDDEKHEVAFDQMANFTRIPQRLNVLSSRLASTQYYCSCFVQVLDCLQDQLQNLPDGHCTKISAELQEQMIYFRVCSEDIGFISKRGNTLVQSMTQTVRISIPTTVKSYAYDITDPRKSSAERQPTQPPVWCRYANHHSNHSNILARNFCCNLL